MRLREWKERAECECLTRRAPRCEITQLVTRALFSYCPRPGTTTTADNGQRVQYSRLIALRLDGVSSEDTQRNQRRRSQLGYASPFTLS